jgi:transcriptional regulator with XRE-family HTH domain
MKTLGERIRELREEKDLSVREFAKRLKVSAPFWSDVELGRRHPSPEVLARAARLLDTTSAELKEYDARPPMQELKRIVASNPAMGFALRRFVNEEASPDDLLEFLKERGKKRR